MKTNYVFLATAMLLFMLTATAQQGINYKAIIYDTNGDALANTRVNVRFSILENGTTFVYQETHSPTTDANGIMIVNIGEGIVIRGNFNVIDWGSNPHFLKTEINTGDGLTDMGTTEFKYVPYALHATNAAHLSGPITETQDLADVIAINNSANAQIEDLTDPDDPQDAATKAYVDQLLTRLEALELYSGIRAEDCDGNQYATVKIGEQLWMAENLKTTKYNDCTDIPLVTDQDTWYMLETGAYCWYNNDEATYKDTYGALYNWFTVYTGKLCPAGWHVPSEEEWTELIDYLGGASLASVKLKEEGIVHWPDPNTGTNESGFTALPGGIRFDGSGFFYNGEGGYWWTSTTTVPGNVCRWCYAYEKRISYNGDIGGSGMNENNGSSIRCVKD